jgi:hypothetical protein
MILLLTTNACGLPTGSIRASGHLVFWEVILPIYEFACVGQCAVLEKAKVVTKKAKECYPCSCFALQ